MSESNHIPKYIDCPSCMDKAAIADVETDIYSRRLNRNVRVRVLSYECKRCGESFTTTESDTVSMLRVHRKVKAETRKESIKKTL
jgi:transcriptional regulator NrdR family protein